MQNLQQSRKKQQPQDSIDVRGTAEHYLHQINPDFIIDEHNEKVVRGLSLFFLRDDRFESEGFGSLQKGVYLAGNVGSGKTTILRTFLETVGEFELFKPRKIALSYSQNGIESFSNYLPRTKAFLNNDGLLENKIVNVLIDDLGTEADLIPASFMGNRLNVIESLIEEFYETRVSMFRNLFFTGNLTGQDIENLYGERTKSRLRETTNFIFLPGPDRRK